jgi:SAM-dependent methyltransferase
VGTGGEAVDAALRVGPTGEVVATDRSAAMIAQAEHAVAERRLVNIRLLVMDAQRLDFPPKTFDAVISRNALMFIPDLPTALAEMRRVLKAAGRIGGTVWASRRRNPRISGPLDAARALGATPPPTASFRIAVRLGSPTALAAAMRNAGFSDVVVERWPVIARFGTLDEAVAQALDHSGTRELVRLLSPGSEERMRRSLERRWRRYSDGHQVRLPGEQLVAAGTR